MTTIIGIKLTNRTELSNEFQTVLSRYGCYIKTRIGIHSTCSSVCANYGIILLEMLDNSELLQMKKELIDIDGVILSTMTLWHTLYAQTYYKYHIAKNISSRQTSYYDSNLTMTLWHTLYAQGNSKIVLSFLLRHRTNIKEKRVQ